MRVLLALLEAVSVLKVGVSRHVDDLMWLFLKGCSLVSRLFASSCIFLFLKGVDELR